MSIALTNQDTIADSSQTSTPHAVSIALKV